ncbi:hypothetical protein N7456_000214 [Penicillium angulare]|uniref:DNA replication regulator SLD2 n=1 Tax=Penicillium angulare TaxID=116970 RepID=A0A9W9GC53_9EURO|nr:hypothetical protein N7456_000214 [Penicillium angulare]
MADQPNSRSELAAQAVSVRSELKIWEREFAVTHEGKKAGRDDIKNNPEIAAKYKEYGRLKNLEAALIRRENRQQQEFDSQAKKRKHTSPTGPSQLSHSTTPRKSARGIFATPTNNRTAKIHPSQLDPYDSPSTFRRLFSPSTHKQGLPAPSPLKAAIGPTPQRDGKALGLFDMLSESGGSNATPSAKRQKDALAAGFRTPSKPKRFDPIAEAPEEEGEEESSRLSRTPASSTKQFYLANLFATPTTMRYAAMVEGEDNNAANGHGNGNGQELEGPVSRHSNPSETPSFLRRSNIGRFPPQSANENGGLSPIASRKPTQFASRGLSSLVQGLRDMEEERMEDDWDVLREIEEEQDMLNFEAMESQAIETEYQRPYKKKGQKRTTRKVNMRPVISKKTKTQTQTQTTPDVSDEESDNENENEVTAVPETQIQQQPTDNAADGNQDQGHDENDIASLHSISDAGSDFEGDTDADSDGDPEYGESAKPPPRPKSFSERIKEAVAMVKPAAKEPAAESTQKQQIGKKAETEKEEKQRPARKLNPQTHANYRSLKIGNRGGGRGRGRFRKR